MDLFEYGATYLLNTIIGQVTGVTLQKQQHKTELSKLYQTDLIFMVSKLGIMYSQLLIYPSRSLSQTADISK